MVRSYIQHQEVGDKQALNERCTETQAGPLYALNYAQKSTRIIR